MDKPLLIFDGECGFCRRFILRWQRRVGDRIDFAPFQEVADRFPHISRSEFSQSVYLIETSGNASLGAEAVFRMLALGGASFFPLWCYRHLPGFRWVAEGCYRVVARHRTFFSKW